MISVFEINFEFEVNYVFGEWMEFEVCFGYV